jgi:hypothetical protein
VGFPEYAWAMVTPGVGAPITASGADKTWVRRVSTLSTVLVTAVIAFSVLQLILGLAGQFAVIDIAISEMVRPMQPMAAVLLGITGTATHLLLVPRRRSLPLARSLGTVMVVGVAIIAGLYLAVYRSSSAADLPVWLRPGGLETDPFAGLPASNTAFVLLILVVSLPLLAAGARRAVLVGQILAATAATIAGRMLVEFLYGSRSLSSFPWGLSEMAVTSAICVIALGAAAVLARWDVGVVSALVGSGPGGIVLRASIPGLLLLPVILLGFLQGQQLLNRSSVFGLLAVAITVLGLVLLMSLARTLDRRDNQRAIATERALRARDALAQRAPAVAVLESQLSTVEPIDRADIEIHAESLTESGVLSGDAHAILNLDDARIGLVLVDVAGHGAEPTVAALRIKDSLAQSLRHGASPVQALVEVSPLLGETAEMATAVVADMQTAGGHLRLVVAGHPPPLLIGNNTVDELAATGPLLHSSIPGAWTHHELTLGEGDTLMLYTDGLTQRPLGDLTKQLRDASSLAETVEWLLRGSGEPAFRDDVSLILLRRLRTRPKVVVDVADTAHNLSPVQSRFFLETR